MPRLPYPEPDLIPLQTHGLYDEVWTPPRSRFVTYDYRDEHWMRLAGLGQIVRQLKPFYDVRDEHNNLLGHTRFNPLNHSYMDVLLQRGDKIDQVRVVVVEYGYLENRYVTWHAMLRDAVALAEGRWIELFGPDNLWAFKRDIEKRQWERQQFHLTIRGLTPARIHSAA